MKETKIAEKNVERMNEHKGIEPELYTRNIIQCFAHKQTCQRWLEFLEELNEQLQRIWKVIDALEGDETTEKITDLKQAIKIYEENGI